MTKQIPLTQGKVALVDDADFQHLNQWKWCARRNRRTDKWYALRHEGRKMIYMHRAITNAPDDMETDHRDNDGLNNQRYNLRVCTHAENTRNRIKRVDNSSGYKGVYKYKKKWRAELKTNGKRILRKAFSTAEEAAHAYDEAATKHFGPFANLNFPK